MKCIDCDRDPNINKRVWPSIVTCPVTGDTRNGYDECDIHGELDPIEPCPFCGGDGHLRHDTACWGHGDYSRVHFVICRKCGAQGPTVDEYDEPHGQAVSSAIKSWNRRIHNA